MSEKHPKCPRCGGDETRLERNFGKSTGRWWCTDCSARWEVGDTPEWACPNCGTTYEGGHHSEEQALACNSATFCQFVCECDEDQETTHGETLADRCMNATCYHCDWRGEFPPLPWKAENLPAWARHALDAGWAPPKGWSPK